MRKYFLTGIGIMVLVAAAGYCVWRLLATLYQMYLDRQLFKEMDEIERQSEQTRARRQQEYQKRLNTGCEHDFDDDRYGALPTNVCGKCGMPQEKPNGPCDHIWRVVEGPTPASVCEKCGKRYSPLDTSGASPS